MLKIDSLFLNDIISSKGNTLFLFLKQGLERGGVTTILSMKLTFEQDPFFGHNS